MNRYLRGGLIVVVFYLIAFVIVSLLNSCHRRPLYYEHGTPVKVIVSMDWRNLGGDPSGASIYFYPEGKTGCYAFKTNSVGKAEVHVPTGYYTVIVFNRSTEEYGTMDFTNMEQLGTAAAVLKTRYVPWLGTPDSVGRVVYDPEVIVSGRTEHFYVREKTGGSFSQKETTRSAMDEADTCYVTPQQMVFTGTVNVRVNGIQNVKSVRSFITGMAGGAYLSTRSATDMLATHVIESWNIVRDEADYTKGYLVGTFACFGLPDQYKTSKLPQNNRFHIKILAIDEETVVARSWDVGDRIVEIEDELRVDLTIGVSTPEHPEDHPIDVPDVKPKGGTQTGFDVSLKDWGETEDVFVPL